MSKAIDLLVDLPQEDEGDVPYKPDLGPYGVRARPVTINAEARAAITGATNPGSTTTNLHLNLNFFPESDMRRTVTDGVFAQLETIMTGILNEINHTNGQTEAYGQVENDPFSFLSVFTKGGFDLTLTSPLYGTFEIEVVNEEANLYVVRQLDEKKMGECGVSGSEEQIFPSAEQERSEDAIALAEDGRVIDVMIVYTEKVREALGEGGVKHRAAAAIAIGNKVLKNSKVDLALNLVHCAEVLHYQESTKPRAYYIMLEELEKGKAPGLQDLHKLRDHYKADVVTLLVANEQLGGLANTMTMPTLKFDALSYNVVNYRVAYTTFTLFHEIAHNLGCCHEDGCSNGPKYARGHSFEVNSIALKTVMVKKSVPGTRLPYLSNPLTKYPEAGSERVETGILGQRDNAKIVAENKKIVANFRMRAVLPPAVSDA